MCQALAKALCAAGLIDSPDNPATPAFLVPCGRGGNGGSKLQTCFLGVELPGGPRSPPLCPLYHQELCSIMEGDMWARTLDSESSH